MKNKNKKVIIGLGLVILITAIALVFIFRKPKPTQQPQQDSNVSEGPNQVERFGLRNFIGKITSVEAGEIKGVASDGIEFTLNVSGSKKTNFLKKTTQEDGIISVESIGLFDIPISQDVAIQYDGKDNTVMLIVVE